MAAFDMNWHAASVDEQLVDEATAAVQAHEKFHNTLCRNKGKGDEVTVKCGQVLDELRDIKSQVDGTAVKFMKTCVDVAVLQEQLKPLVLMHVPQSLTAQVKLHMTSLVETAFKGTCKRVLFCGLVCCPWYEATQDERGLAAKHNSLFVIYQNHDEQFFSPVNCHVREQNDVVDHGWFYAAELFHFGNYLTKGKSRFVEICFLPESAIVYEHPEWKVLQTTVDKMACSRLRGFVEQCRGQAVGAVGKKKKSGQFAMRDTATLYEFCESFRLLQHASMALDGLPLCMQSALAHNSSDIASAALQKIKMIYQKDDMAKTSIFEVVMQWRSMIDEKVKKFKFTPPQEIEQPVGKWMSKIRVGHKQIIERITSQCTDVRNLMQKVGGAVADMDERDILLIARAGSYLYGLNTASSDIDYIIVYATPTQKLLQACKRPSESVENRGPQLQCEYGAYEARLFTEMLWKGSVVILEIVFASNLEYTSAAWQVLHQHQHLFLTERAILQYFGLIQNNMTMLKTHRHKDKPGRERKLFYQIYHKLWSLEYFVRGEIPPIHCDESTKKFIMTIRTGELVGEFSHDALFKAAEQKIIRLRDQLAARNKRLPENVNYDFLLNWLLAVRGWNVN